MPEGKKQQQETENLFEQIKVNFPNLVKEIDFQEVHQPESPKEVGPSEEHTKAHQH